MASSARENLRVVLVGHVGHGKSTLVGRLIHDTGNLPEGRLEAIQALCRRRGMPFEWAFVRDAFQAERDRGVAIDASQIRLRQAGRDYVVVDPPGHLELLKDMVSGAAADAALLVIDAAEGVKEPSRRHGYLLRLLGVGQVVVALNKMDLVGYDEGRFRAVEADYRAYLTEIGVEVRHIIPVSAREGANMVERAPAMAWYDGPTVLEALAGFRVVSEPESLPLRLPVQDVYKFDERQIVAGRIECGVLKVGDTLQFSPSNRIARVASIEAWNVPAPPLEARAGESIGITLDRPVPIERGELASHLDDMPWESDVFRARLFWLGRRPLAVGDTYKLKLNTGEATVRVQSIEKVVDTTDLSTREAAEVGCNDVAEVTLRASHMLALDPFDENPRTGRFVLVDGYDIAGGGIIDMRAYADQRQLITRRATNVQRVEHDVSIAAREARNGHRGGVIWLTGLSGSGKSTIALATERRLFTLGYQVYVLDGDNVRHGLCADLGFSPEDRAENIRRVGEVAALMARAGLIVITAFISPYRSDRERAREAAGAHFHEIYVKADLSTCEARDPKGLYKKARAGEIAEFTGITAPYEAPDRPDLTVQTDSMSVETAVDAVLQHIVARLIPQAGVAQRQAISGRL